MKSGKYWVLGILAFGALLATLAVLYWRRPETRVLWSFTQIHTALVRNRKPVAASFVAVEVRAGDRSMSRDEFLETYRPPAVSGEPEAAPCPAAPGHWAVRLRGLAYCFRLEEKLWKLHQLGPEPCACR